jgi:hypothetical protein
MLGTAIVNSVRRTLRDSFAQTQAHKDEDFVDYINRAAKVVVNADASASVVTDTIPLVAGNVQKIPATGSRILNLLHNDLDKTFSVRVSGRQYKGKHAVKNMPLATLQSQIPDWAGGEEVPIVSIICFNDDDPTSFINYPANDGTGLVKATYAITPVDLVVIGDDMAIPDRYFNIMVNITISMALARDSENRELMARSQAFMQTALGELGAKEAKDTEETPTNTLGT